MTVEKKDRALPGMPKKKRSRSARLGYDGEHAVELYLHTHGFPVYRPRAGSPQDRGDLIGQPLVISVKNYANPRLAEWVDALPRMRTAAEQPVGVVWHKRRGRGSPADWYVTMTGTDFLVFLAAYKEAGHG